MFELTYVGKRLPVLIDCKVNKCHCIDKRFCCETNWLQGMSELQSLKNVSACVKRCFPCGTMYRVLYLTSMENVHHNPNVHFHNARECLHSLRNRFNTFSNSSLPLFTISEKSQLVEPIRQLCSQFFWGCLCSKRKKKKQHHKWKLHDTPNRLKWRPHFAASSSVFLQKVNPV